jgi:hypothetical protein
MAIDQNLIAILDPIAEVRNFTVHGDAVGADQLFHIAPRPQACARQYFL